MLWDLHLRWEYVVGLLIFGLIFTVGGAIPLFRPQPDAGQPIGVEGRTVVKSDGAHGILVTVDDGLTDHRFRLFTDDTVASLDQSFPHARVDYLGRELRIVPKDQDVVITLALRSVPARTESAAKVMRYTGYGLQHEMQEGLWTPLLHVLGSRP